MPKPLNIVVFLEENYYLVYTKSGYKCSKMKSFFDWIRKNPKKIRILYILAIVICLLLCTIIILGNDFSKLDDKVSLGGSSYGDPNCVAVIENLSMPSALKYKEQLKSIDGIGYVHWLDDYADIAVPLSVIPKDALSKYYPDGNARFELCLIGSSVESTVKEIKTSFGESILLSGAAIEVVRGIQLMRGIVYALILLLAIFTALLIYSKLSENYERREKKPKPAQQPEPIQEPEPEPVVVPEPEPIPQPEPEEEPIVVIEPEPIPQPEPEPIVIPEPEPEPIVVPEPEPIPEPEPEPIVALEPEPIKEPTEAEKRSERIKELRAEIAANRQSIMEKLLPLKYKLQDAAFMVTEKAEDVREKIAPKHYQSFEEQFEAVEKQFEIPETNTDIFDVGDMNKSAEEEVEKIWANDFFKDC